MAVEKNAKGPTVYPCVVAQDISRQMLFPAQLAALMLPQVATTEDSPTLEEDVESVPLDVGTTPEEDTSALKLAANFTGLLFTPPLVEPAPLHLSAVGVKNEKNRAPSIESNLTGIAELPASASPESAPAISPLETAAMLPSETKSSERNEQCLMNDLNCESQFGKPKLETNAALLQSIESLSEPTVKMKKLSFEAPRDAVDAARPELKRLTQMEMAHFGPEIFNATPDQIDVTRTSGTQPLSDALSSEAFIASVARTKLPLEAFNSETDTAITAGDRTLVSTQNSLASFAEQAQDVPTPDLAPAQRLVRATLDAIPKPLAAMNIEIQSEGFGPIHVRISVPQAGAANSCRVEIRSADPAARALLTDSLRELQGSLKTDWITVQPLSGPSSTNGSGASAEDKYAGGRDGERRNFYDPQRQPGKRSQQELFELFSEQR